MSTEPVVIIRCREDGPLVIHGAVRIVDHQGNELTPPSGKALVALCRCGHTGNRPFCDGSHKRGSEATAPTSS